MVRVDLERKIETLHEELDYTRKVRMEEVEDLKQQIQGQFKNEKMGIYQGLNFERF